MPKEEWGVKRLCPSCASRFYDLMRDPATCPNCGESFDLDSLSLSKNKTSKDEGTKVREATASDNKDSDEALEDDADAVLDDDSVLDDDDDDTVNLDDLTDVPADDTES